jgi:hypothetical protein
MVTKCSLIILLTCASLFSSACSRRVKNTLEREELTAMIKGGDSLAHPGKSAVACQDYGKGCTGGFSMVIDEMEVLFVEFHSIEEARAAANNLGQWFTYNYLIDNVSGERNLEDFVLKHLKATPGTGGI